MSQKQKIKNKNKKYKIINKKINKRKRKIKNKNKFVYSQVKFCKLLNMDIVKKSITFVKELGEHLNE